jgi:hypothetical protein
MHCMKTALLPATRIEPSLRRQLEAVLEKGETLSAFVEAAVRRQLQVRESQRTFIARGLAAERSADRQGDWIDASEVLAEIEALAAELTVPPSPSRRRAK